MRRETFSRLPLADACPGSMALPWTDSSSSASSGGIVLHAHLQRLRTLGEDEALDLVPPDWQAAVAEWDTSGLPLDPAAWAGEVAYALDLEAMTARELGRDIGRRYREAGALERELVGAADAVALVGADGVVVGDLKTGYAWVPPPRDNLQIRGLLAAAQLAYGRSEGVGIVWHRRLDGSGWTERATLDALDQADTLSTIGGVLERTERARTDVLEGRRPRLNEGAWCARCPALPSCPAKRDLVVDLAVHSPTKREIELGQDDDDLAARLREQLTPEGAALAYQRLLAVDAVVARLWRTLREYATEHPIDLGGGRMFGPVVSDRESLDGAVAWHVIRDAYGEEIAWASSETRVTKTGEHSIEAAVRAALAANGPVMEPGKNGKPRKVPMTQLQARLVDEIRRRGGAKTKPVVSVREFTRRED